MSLVHFFWHIQFLLGFTTQQTRQAVCAAVIYTLILSRNAKNNTHTNISGEEGRGHTWCGFNDHLRRRFVRLLEGEYPPFEVHAGVTATEKQAAGNEEEIPH